MTTIKYVRILLPLILFVVVGATGAYSQDYLQNDNTIYYWFTLPAFILGIYYAFALTPQHPRSEGGRVALKRIILTIIIFAFSYRSMNGYVIYSNCYIGKQTEKQMTGKVTFVKVKDQKLIFDKNSIEVLPDNNDNSISLEVPDNNYTVGQVFSKNMMVGSLGILYSHK